MDKLCKYYLDTMNLKLHHLWHLKKANERIISRLKKALCKNKDLNDYSKGAYFGNIQAYIDMNREIKNILRRK
ncbi:hypothetical protein [Caminicella sporogenes]|uniref:hypothetical protein n=1 Tax=Caminicella sporogenes TaxID=166485 RepID=UPI00254245C5|nr:hypothetical protein [Caminicella sporogenes]WIF95049.1 hypothetical protein QNI18_12425 [Caminicella sporogenes]